MDAQTFMLLKPPKVWTLPKCAGGPTGAYCVRGPRGLGYAGRAEADDRPLELYEAAQRKAKHAIGHFLTSDAGRVIFCWGLLR
jgi:hypothetical protein